MLYQVKNRSAEQRYAAEILPGHPVAEDEAVSIKLLDFLTIIPSKFSAEERIEALRALSDRFAKVSRPDFSTVEEGRALTRRFAPGSPTMGL